MTEALGRACEVQSLRHEGLESRAGIPPGQSEHRHSPLPAPLPGLLLLRTNIELMPRGGLSPIPVVWSLLTTVFLLC